MNPRDWTHSSIIYDIMYNDFKQDITRTLDVRQKRSQFLSFPDIGGKKIFIIVGLASNLFDT